MVGYVYYITIKIKNDVSIVVNYHIVSNFSLFHTITKMNIIITSCYCVFQIIIFLAVYRYSRSFTMFDRAAGNRTFSD